VAAVGGSIFRSTDDAQTWTHCTGATYTSGNEVLFNQYNSKLYITTGVDNIILYDGTTTLTSYVSLGTPGEPTVVETGTGLTSGTAYQYYYRCSRVNSIGFSIRSNASTVIQTGLPREEWTAGTNYATLTLPALEGTQTRYDVYVSVDDVDYYYLGSTNTTTYVDDGTALVNPSIIAPTGNTSQGPKVEELVNVGSRMYGVRDTQNKYRIWFSSGTEPKGSFSSAYDGGYIDWQEGGKYIPQKVEDYRDGKGTPLATVWCDSADGQGCILQISLDVLTIGDISITVPSAYKLPGSRGTPSPGSVVNVLNDYMYYNSQAFYNLGSRAQFLNLLSTDEASANIRDTIRLISADGEAGIASAYYDAKVYFSVPYGATTNNYTVIYDTERKAWLPRAFNLGFKKFLRYTDTSGTRHLLALKPGDSKLTEISSSFGGDYGEAFETVLTTGIYPVSKNRFDYQYVEEGQVEFSNPNNEVNIQLLGVDRQNGYGPQISKSTTFVSTLADSGWETETWESDSWDSGPETLVVASEPTAKRYFRVQKDLNAVQWRLTTNSLNAFYLLRTLQTWGTPTQAGVPRQWRI
jgi:hypothetical protein